MKNEQNVPQVRFKGFTDAWEQRKLKSITSVITKGTTPLDKSNSGTVNFIKVENIDNSSGEISISQKISKEEHEGYLKRSQLQENDILFSIAGTLGRVTSVNSDILPANTNQALAIIRLKECNLDYIKTFLKSKAVTDYIKRNPTVGAQPNLSLEQVGNLEIQVPSLREQQSIGNYFKSLDNLITLHQRKCETLQKLKKSMLQKMFPKNGSLYPEIRFAGFTDAWEQRKLGECFDERTERSADGELIAVTINSGVVKASELNRHDNSSEDKSNYKVVRVNDIAYNSMRMWQGASGYSQYDGILSPAYTVVIPRENVNPVFFSYMFKITDLIHEFQINSQGLTSDTWNLKFPAFSTISANVPKSEEQQAIGNYFTNLDNLITLHQRKLETLKKMKKSMLQKMFI